MLDFGSIPGGIVVWYIIKSIYKYIYIYIYKYMISKCNRILY